MPDEFDFKNYKNIEDYLQSVEGSKYYHDLYLKAVNHPIRREILAIINTIGKISEKKLVEYLMKENIINNNGIFDYNIEFLIKALCIIKKEENNKSYYEITQSGKVVEYFK